MRGSRGGQYHNVKTPTSVLATIKGFEQAMARFVDTSTENTWLVHWETVTEGARQAVGRYEDSLGGRGSGLRARIALGESLWWLASAEEYLRCLLGLEDNQAWYGQPGLPESAKVLGALTYARHRAGHQFADMLAFAEDSASTTFDVVNPDGSIRTSTVVASVERSLRLRERTPDDYLFSSHVKPGPHREKWDRAKWFAQYLAGKPVLPILRYSHQSLAMSIRVSLDDGSGRDAEDHA